MAREENSQTNTIVGPNTVIQGNLDIKGSLLIYGTVLGDVHSNGQVRTAKDSMIKGNVVADEAIIDGELDGSLTTKGRATLGNSARMIGDLQAALLVIEEGAQYSGKCKMDGAKVKSAPAHKDRSRDGDSLEDTNEKSEVEAEN